MPLDSDPRVKIRALLVKAEHAGTPEHEATLSRAMAERLCAKYGLELEDVRTEPTVRFTAGPRMADICTRCWGAYHQMDRPSGCEGGRVCMPCWLDLLALLVAEATPRATARCQNTYDRLRAYLTDADTCLDCGRRVAEHVNRKERIDHSACSHETTPSARAKCRRAREKEGNR